MARYPHPVVTAQAHAKPSSPDAKTQSVRISSAIKYEAPVTQADSPQIGRAEASVKVESTAGQSEPKLNRAEQKCSDTARKVGPECVAPEPEVVVVDRIDESVGTDESDHIYARRDYDHAQNQSKATTWCSETRHF
jgi:hypothetical protein